MSAVIIYALLMIALLSVILFPSEKLLGNIGMVGAVVTYLAWRFVRIDLERILYGSIQDFRIPRLGILGTGRGVGLTPLMLVLGGVMLLLVFFSRNQALDGEQ
jgi:hypothetical protein